MWKAYFLKGQLCLKFFHCMKNHQLKNCPKINDTQKKDIVNTKQNDWLGRNTAAVIVIGKKKESVNDKCTSKF